jgi:hypothetical protein
MELAGGACCTRPTKLKCPMYKNNTNRDLVDVAYDRLSENAVASFSSVGTNRAAFRTSDDEQLVSMFGLMLL